jgi:hypothetical protein
MVLSDHVFEEIEGDLIQKFSQIVKPWRSKSEVWITEEDDPVL